MAAPQALGKETLPEEVVKKDRKNCTKYDQCGLGQKAIYMGGTVSPRKYYVPYSSVTNVFRRVAVSNGSGKGFLTPILYIVVRFDGGEEKQCSFRYMTDADRMMEQLEREHPEISLLSPEGEKKAREKQEREEHLKNAPLSKKEEQQIRMLSDAQITLKRKPSLYENLAGAARLKRTQDLMRPGAQGTAVVVFAAGAAVLLAGVYLQMRGGLGYVPAVLMLAGIAAMFMMINSKALPSPKRNRKSLNRLYQDSLSAMEKSLKKESGFPLPAEYAHPVVIERMIRIIREGRAHTSKEALEVLKSDLKAADSSVALSGDDYKEVVLIKPLFTVNDYR